MKFVIYLNNQSIQHEGKPSFEEFLQFVTNSLDKVPQKSFALSYIDGEGDKIDLTSDQDMTAMIESMSKYPDVNVFIQSEDELKFFSVWECSTCTFFNSMFSDKCEVCESIKSENAKEILTGNPKTIEKSKIKSQIQKPEVVKPVFEKVEKVENVPKLEKVEENNKFKPTEKLLNNVKNAFEPLMKPLNEIFKQRQSSKKEEAPKEVSKAEKLEKLDEKLLKLQEKKEKLQKKVKKAKKVQILAQEKPVEKKEEKVVEKKEENHSIFLGIEKNFEKYAQQFIDGKIDETKFNLEWNNEAQILKKRVNIMKAQAIKCQKQKVESNQVSELEKKKLELQKQLEEINVSIEKQSKLEEEKKAKVQAEKKVAKVKKMQIPVEPKQVEVNPFQEMKNHQEKNLQSIEFKLETLVQIYGGAPVDYQDYVLIYPDASIEDLCDMVSQARFQSNIY